MSNEMLTNADIYQNNMATFLKLQTLAGMEGGGIWTDVDFY